MMKSPYRQDLASLEECVHGASELKKKTEDPGCVEKIGRV